MRIQAIPYLSWLPVVIFTISGMIMCGCDRRPEGVLSDKKMVEVMTDLQIAEAYAYNQIHGSNTTDEREELSLAVLEAHGVTKEQLDTTLGWYGRNMDIYEKLYEKVDKRIEDKRKKLLDVDGKTVNKNEGDDLWPFGRNGLISSLGNSDGWRISIPNPEISKGDRLEWSMHINSTSFPLVGVLGVDYEDGTSEALTTMFNHRQDIEFSFQTDTAKTVTRIFGTMRIKDTSELPLFADSISLRSLPFDSLEFNKFRAQRKYGVPVRIKKDKDKLRSDSLADASKGKDSRGVEKNSQEDKTGDEDSGKSVVKSAVLSKDSKLKPDTTGIDRRTKLRPVSGRRPPVPRK